MQTNDFITAVNEYEIAIEIAIEVTTAKQSRKTPVNYIAVIWHEGEGTPLSESCLEDLLKAMPAQSAGENLLQKNLKSLQAAKEAGLPLHEAVGIYSVWPNHELRVDVKPVPKQAVLAQ